jgi:hypothetical protein
LTLECSVIAIFLSSSSTLEDQQLHLFLLTRSKLLEIYLLLDPKKTFAFV